MQLDSRTITLMGMAAAMLFSMLGVLVGRNSQTCPGFFYWTLANLSVSLSLLLIGLSGIIPDAVAIVGANSLAIAGSLLILEGARRFRGKTGFWWPASAAGTLTMAIVCYFGFAVDDLNTRLALLSLFLGVSALMAARHLFSVIRPGYRLSLGFTATMLALFSVAQFARVGYAYAQPRMMELFTPSPVFAILMVGTVLFIIAWSFGFFMINHDFLVEHLMEAQRRAAEADRAKNDFLANVSHEIRTPMNGVLGLTELMLDTPLDATQRDYAETIRECGTSVLRLVNDLLDLSKIAAGKIELEEAPFDLRVAVEKTVELLSWKARYKGLELIWEVEPEVPGTLIGDADRLRQVLTNLTANALKFTGRGQVSIRVALKEAPAVLRFSVTDTGPGIPRTEQSRLFERFEQMKDAWQNGTGLGLAISKELVECMGGEIGVTSEEGKGSTFWFTAVFREPG
jgi:signal transduction histidine kinase